MTRLELPRLPDRAVDAHKGTFGHGFLIGGAMGMTGAISIAGLACLRAGAGLVTLGVPKCSQAIVACFDPNFMTLPLSSDCMGRLNSTAEFEMRELLGRVTCVAIGPGLGRSDSSDAIATKLFQEFDGGMILDADGLNALSASMVWRDLVRGEIEPRKAMRVLTPHPGEWERLSGISATDRVGQIDAAHRLAAKTNCIVLLKGRATFITDGQDSFINKTGNASMATGGTGDCLTGIIAGLVCQGLTGIDAARLGSHLHGLAGDLAHAELKTPSSLATDLIRFLPAAFGSLAN